MDDPSSMGELRARVAHSNAPRINGKRPPEDAPSRDQRIRGERHVAPILRVLHDVRTRYVGKEGTYGSQRAFEYDVAQAVREYLTIEGIKIPVRFGVSWLFGEHTPRVVISGCMMTIAQFAHVIEPLSE